MADLEMSSSDSSVIEEKQQKNKEIENLVGFLGKEDLKALEPELKLADDLMKDLSTKASGSGKKGSTKKGGRQQKEKGLKAKKTIVKKEQGTSKGKKNAGGKKNCAKKGKVTKSKKNADDGADQQEEFDENNSVKKSDSSSDSSSISSPSSDESDQSESSGNEKKKKAGTSAKQHVLSFLQDFGRVQTFGQCQDCQTEQKSLDSPVHFMGGLGIIARVIQCDECLEGNAKIRRIENHYFGAKTQKTETGEEDFYEESDDYKCQSPAYLGRVGQCNYCYARQTKLGEKAMEKHDEFYHLLLAQCVNCVFANKTAKQTYYKFFSSWSGGGGGVRRSSKKKGGKGGKRRRIVSTSSEDEPKKKKNKSAKKSKK